MDSITKKEADLNEYGDISVRLYRNQGFDGKVNFSIVVHMSNDDCFILDNRSRSLLLNKLENILPVALLSRGHKYDNRKPDYSLLDYR